MRADRIRHLSARILGNFFRAAASIPSTVMRCLIEDTPDYSTLSILLAAMGLQMVRSGSTSSSLPAISKQTIPALPPALTPLSAKPSRPTACSPNYATPPACPNPSPLYT
jgi:hypothetical protein